MLCKKKKKCIELITFMYVTVSLTLVKLLHLIKKKKCN